ncbi:helix-turn-helix domain-containing protein [Pseudobutyrivibrio sp.]|uniref:helix-turn-helix domain-containing protein n=1 Tax=Pseudobutyrivibrio sp. TaxID=2014367 RepID=UPI0025DAFC86|nr:helix-turn-helix transcriptional regulator [Pseudobutyrivibrio sp.]MBR5650041.1 helix-turn-helix transcriptional regulator [Pseudobutyrivibrio sp.]
MVEFGEQLRRAREEKGMTQQTLAEQLFVSRQSVSRWECGDRYPDLITTKKISQILDVSLDDLMSGKEMIKVVERNPVIENKVANNIMIALYAIVVLYYSIDLVNELLALYVQPDKYLWNWGIAISALKIVIFTYGLVTAIRGTLSPKKMGVVIAAFLGLKILNFFIELAEGFYLDGTSMSMRGIWLDCIFSIVLVLAVLILFIGKKNQIIWLLVISFLSLVKIIRNLIDCYDIISFARFNNSLPEDQRWIMVSDTTYSSVISLLLPVALYALIIFQTYTLYRKRKILMNFDESNSVPVR